MLFGEVSLGSLLKEVFCINSKYALYNFISRNLKLKYRKSVLGILWTVMIPACTAVVYYFVFKYVMRVAIPNYLVFVLSGVIPWAFFQTAVLNGLESVVNNHAILNKVPINIAIFPLSEVVTSLVNMILALPVVVLVLVIYRVSPNIYWLQLPVLLCALFLLAYFIALLCSVMFVYLRDLRPIMAVVMQVWFYLTPVLYGESMVPEKFDFIKYLNPVWFIFSGIRRIVLDSSGLFISEYLVVMLWCFLSIFVGAIVFFLNRNSLVERI